MELEKGKDDDDEEQVDPEAQKRAARSYYSNLLQSFREESTSFRKPHAHINPIQQSKNLQPTMPTWHMVKKVKTIMGGLFILLGAVGLGFYVTMHNRCSVVSTDFTAKGEPIGKSKETPVAERAGSICPSLQISVCAVLCGIWILGSMYNPTILLHIQNECIRHYMSTVMYVQLCFQSSAVVLCILPLSGVVNVYELIFATTLVAVEMVLCACSDMLNEDALHNWELLNALVEKGREDTEETLLKRNWPNLPQTLTFKFAPVFGALFCYAVVFIVIIAHVANAHAGGHVDAGFVVLVVITLVLQGLLIAIKIMQMTPSPFTTVFKVYKFTLISLEVVEFVNFVAVIVGLIIILD